MKCCHCIPVQLGTCLIAIVGLLICVMELTLLVPYLMNPDSCQNTTTRKIDPFKTDGMSNTNMETLPIHCNNSPLEIIVSGLNMFENFLRKELTKQNRQGEVKEILQTFNTFVWPTFLTLTIEAVIYVLSCILVIVAICCCCAKLTIIFLICHIIRMILCLILGIGIMIGFYYIDTMMCVGLGALIMWFFFIFGLPAIYSWNVVKTAYVSHKTYNVVEDDHELQFLNHRSAMSY